MIKSENIFELNACETVVGYPYLIREEWLLEHLPGSHTKGQVKTF